MAFSLILAIQLTPIVSRAKSQEIGINFTIIDCSSAHFVPFLFYYYCTMSIVELPIKYKTN